MRPFEVSVDSSFYYYLRNGSLTLALRLALTLDHEVVRPSLAAALERAARTYPQFSSRLAYADGRFWYVGNDESVMPCEVEGEAFSLGGTDTNHYLYRVWASGTELGIICNHGIADARHLVRFATTLMYYYATDMGIIDEDDEMEGVTREGDLGTPAYDPTVREAQVSRRPSDASGAAPSFCLPVSYSEDEGDYRCHVEVISVGKKDLRDLARRAQSRMSPLIMALEARALGRVWDTTGHLLAGPLMYDARQCFESAGVGNFSGWVTAMLPPRLVQADLPVQCAVLQRAMEVRLNKDALRVPLGRSIPMVAAERGKPLSEVFSSAERQREEVHDFRRDISLYVSNVGEFRLPEPLSSIIVAAECCIPSFTTSYGLTMIGVGDTIRMTYVRTFEDTSLSRAFVSELADSGVEATCEVRGRRAFPTTGRDAVLELEGLA